MHSKLLILIVTLVLISTSSILAEEESYIIGEYLPAPVSITGFIFSCKHNNQALKDEIDCHIPDKYKTDQILIYTASNIPSYPALCLDSVIKNVIPDAEEEVKYIWQGSCKINSHSRYIGDGYFKHNSTVIYNNNSTDFTLTDDNGKLLFSLTLPALSSSSYTKYQVKDTDHAITSHIHYFGPDSLTKGNESEIVESVCEKTYKTSVMSLDGNDFNVYLHRVNKFNDYDLYINEDLAQMYGLKSSFTKKDLIEESCAVMIWDHVPELHWNFYRVTEFNKEVDNINLATFDDISNTVMDLPAPYNDLTATQANIINVTHDVGKLLFDYVEDLDNSSSDSSDSSDGVVIGMNCFSSLITILLVLFMML